MFEWHTWLEANKNITYSKIVKIVARIDNNKKLELIETIVFFIL